MTSHAQGFCPEPVCPAKMRDNIDFDAVPHKINL